MSEGQDVRSERPLRGHVQPRAGLGELTGVPTGMISVPMPSSSPSTVPELAGRSVWVIDTLSRVYQLFHALPEMSSPQGTPVAAIYGFTRDLLDIIEK